MCFSHLLLLVLLVLVEAGRLVRGTGQAVRSIAVVVHHIQAAHSGCGEEHTPETSHGLYPRAHRCLHICPDAHKGHAVQFAYRQSASRCAQLQLHKMDQNRDEPRTLDPKELSSDKSSPRC